MAYEKINVRITRRDSDGVYQITSIKGAVTLEISLTGKSDDIDTLRVGDEVSEKEAKHLSESRRVIVTVVNK